MILHIDMDAFFASVEQKDRPELREKPLVVGGDSGRGVVAAASYEARRYGIHSAMPIFMAKQRCPQLVIVSSRKGRYGEVSRSIMAILHHYSPIVEQVSIDEAYLDATGCSRLYGPPEAMARAIKTDITKNTGLTCSIGVAPLKFLAKIASDMHKPDGLTVISHKAVPEFIDSLPIQKVQGVGKTAYSQLQRMGIVTLGDVKKAKSAFILDRMGKFGHRLVDLAHGRDASRVIPHSPTKSISTERTLRTDTNDREQLKKHLLAQCQEVGRQLRRQGYLARTITVKMKDRDFKQITRNITLDRPSQSTETIYHAAADLLQHHRLDKALRLIGVGASVLLRDTTPRQKNLFDDTKKQTKNWEQVDRALDEIADRFGRSAVCRGSLTPKK